jgi:hypothetical protein
MATKPREYRYRLGKVFFDTVKGATEKQARAAFEKAAKSAGFDTDAYEVERI